MDLVKSPQLPQQLAEKYEREADRYWDLFYRRNLDRFFKDRHYFDREFPELLKAGTVLEVGCGVGNTIFPLLELNPQAFVYACDFAPSAVEIVRAHPQYASCGRVHAFVADITLAGAATAGTAASNEPAPTLAGGAAAGPAARRQEGSVECAAKAAAQPCQPVLEQSSEGETSLAGGSNCSVISRSSLATEVPAGSVDACTMVFVLSAISPEKMPQAIRNVAATLRPGTGQVLFRDYAAGDLAEERLAGEGRSQRIADGFYARWDGTRAFYFTEEGLQSLFEAQGFRCEYVQITHRQVENRKRGDCMRRRFVQAVFTYLGDSAQQAQQVQQAQQQSTEAPAAQAAALSAIRGCCSSAAQEGAQRSSGGACGSSSAEEQKINRGADVAVDLGPVAFCLTDGPPTPAQLLLARLVMAAGPSLLHQKLALELGSYSTEQAPTGLASLAALRFCRFAVATAPSAALLGALRHNACLNSARVVFERLRLQELGWRAGGRSSSAVSAAMATDPAGSGSGQHQHQQQQQQQGQGQQGKGGTQLLARQQRTSLLQAFPCGFDLLMGADLAGTQQDAEQLAQLVAALLAPGSASLAVLCQARAGSSGEAAPGLGHVSAASAALGLEEAGCLPEGMQKLVVQAGSAGVDVLCLRRAQLKQ